MKLVVSAMRKKDHEIVEYLNDQRIDNKALVNDVDFECGDSFGNVFLEIAFGGVLDRDAYHAHILEFVF